MRRIALCAALLGCLNTAHATSVRDGEDMFPEQQRGGWTQVMLGLAQLGIAKQVWPEVSIERKAQELAARELALVKQMPTTETERVARMNAAARAIALKDQVTGGLAVRVGALNDLNEELDFLARNPAVSVDEKLKRIAAAEDELMRRTEDLLRATEREGGFVKGVRWARYLGSIVIGVDVATRVYIWNVMEANPTISPVGNLAWETIRQLWP